MEIGTTICYRSISVHWADNLTNNDRNIMPKGLDDRERDQDGTIRKKRIDTHVGTIEKEYKIDLGMRSDAKLGTALERFGVEDLSQLLKQARKKSS